MLLVLKSRREAKCFIGVMFKKVNFNSNIQKAKIIKIFKNSKI